MAVKKEMKNEDFQKILDAAFFDLPEELIARYPTVNRGDSRLLFMENGKLSDSNIHSMGNFINDEYLLVRNRTKVSRRRVLLKRQSGAVLETLFLSSNQDLSWNCLIRGKGKLKADEIVYFNEKFPFQYKKHPEKTALLQPLNEDFINNPESFFETYGSMPIPPYMKRNSEIIDEDRYQTIYAQTPGSAAAPTAGLHLTESILAGLMQKGLQIADLSLNIGYGTFAPLEEENFTTKSLHTESYSISAESASLLNSGKKILAVGTTTLRALESNYRNFGFFKSGNFTTDIFIFPPDKIHSTHGLLTNFHLPGSSLYLLVCSFAGMEEMKNAYEHAVKNRYRFFSYGDAMLILM